MPRTDDPKTLLASVPLFSDCTKRELQTIGRVIKKVHFPAGTIICKEGEDGVGMHIIQSGRVKVQVGGRTRATLGPGQFLGEISVLDGGPRTATCFADTDVDALSLPAWQMRNVIKEHPGLALKLLEVLCDRLRAANLTKRD